MDCPASDDFNLRRNQRSDSGKLAGVFLHGEAKCFSGCSRPYTSSIPYPVNLPDSARVMVHRACVQRYVRHPNQHSGVCWLGVLRSGSYGVFVLRRKEPNTPRPFKVPGYPYIPAAFVVFAAVFLTVTVYNDVTAYRAAIVAGKPGIINCAFGTFLVLLGTPIYFFYRAKRSQP